MIERLGDLDGVRLWRVDLDRAGAAALAWRTLSSPERDRYAEVVAGRRRARRKVCRGAMREALGEALGLPPARVPVGTGPFGKPLVLGAPRAFVSVAHSGPIGVIAVSREGPVGVDVELPRPTLDPVRFARRWFSAREARAIAGLTGPLAADGALRCWTMKEAAAKALGVPLGGLLDRIVVEADPARAARLLSAPRADAARFELHELCLPEQRARVAVARFSRARSI